MVVQAARVQQLGGPPLRVVKPPKPAQAKEKSKSKGSKIGGAARLGPATSEVVAKVSEKRRSRFYLPSPFGRVTGGKAEAKEQKGAGRHGGSSAYAAAGSRKQYQRHRRSLRESFSVCLDLSKVSQIYPALENVFVTGYSRLSSVLSSFPHL